MDGCPSGPPRGVLLAEDEHGTDLSLLAQSTRDLQRLPGGPEEYRLIEHEADPESRVPLSARVEPGRGNLHDDLVSDPRRRSSPLCTRQRHWLLIAPVAVFIGLILVISSGTDMESSDTPAPSVQLWSLPIPFFGATTTTTTTITETSTETTITSTSSTSTSTVTSTLTSTTSSSTTITTSSSTTTSTTSKTSTTTSTSTTTLPPCWPRPTSKGKEVVKGISYAPVPMIPAGDKIPNDDFMAAGMEAFWGERSKKGKARGDMEIIKALGANTVRLYGNDPAKSHRHFFDAAAKHDLDVIAGFSDYPYTQMNGNCVSTKFDCFKQIKEQYIMNLQGGFLESKHSYNPNLRTIILMNEPDLKILGETRNFCKALISAFDAVVEAEKYLEVKGEAPNFTVAFSFGQCPRCKHHGNLPGLGQMIAFRDAMRDPESVGYRPKNDLWTLYKTRFMNSINTANPSIDVRNRFISHYEQNFKGTPVLITEYHAPEFFDQEADLKAIMQTAKDPSNHLVGICFFEFQVRYDKGGAEMSFGMFGLDKDLEIAQAMIAWKEFPAVCLTPVKAKSREQCGKTEDDLDYVSENPWGFAIDHVVSPEMCCSKCKEFDKCKAWTWVEDAGLPGPCKSQCWVKGGEPVRKDRKLGVVSGLRNAESKSEKQTYVHDVLARAFGGKGLDLGKVCPVATTTTSTIATTTKGKDDDEDKENSTKTRKHLVTSATVAPSELTTERGRLWPWPSAQHVIKAVSYDPLPVKTPGYKAPGTQDFMSKDARVFWGDKASGKGKVGRRDLSIMKKLGVNAVRLYSADPSLDHTAFLDEAKEQELEVIAGIGDYLFWEMPGNCLHTNLDCFHQMRDLYSRFLRKGFLLNQDLGSGGARTYHPSLRTVVLMNKPDTKLHGDIAHFFRALISAFDGVLQAEKEIGVAGAAPNITVTFSFAQCKQCAPTGNHPGLGQMLALRGTMREPTLVQYNARNDLWKFYEQRFVNSIDATTDAGELRRLFLGPYDRHFQGTPVFVGEYHAPGYVDQKKDLQSIMSIAEDPSTLLLGLSFFEYQVRYDEGCAERSFGMFGLSDDKAIAVADMGYGAFTSWCLTPMETKSPGKCNMEEDTLYEYNGGWKESIDHMPNAEICCTKCKERKKCKSWTWVMDAGLSGCPSQCLLWGGEPTGKKTKEGAISGVPDNREIRYIHEVIQDVYKGAGISMRDLCPVNATTAEKS